MHQEHSTLRYSKTIPRSYGSPKNLLVARTPKKGEKSGI